MLHWVTANLSTIIVSAVLLAIIVAISTYLTRHTKTGPSAGGLKGPQWAMPGLANFIQKKTRAGGAPPAPPALHKKTHP